jgi:hypothetical protein
MQQATGTGAVGYRERKKTFPPPTETDYTQQAQRGEHES